MSVLWDLCYAVRVIDRVSTLLFFLLCAVQSLHC